MLMCALLNSDSFFKGLLSDQLSLHYLQKLCHQTQAVVLLDTFITTREHRSAEFFHDVDERDVAVFKYSRIP